MSSLKRRLLSSFGANSFGRIIATLMQIISVPIYLNHWGTNLYGEWILLNTIPGYFAFSDMGFGSVAGNEMTMLMATERREEALEVFQSVWVLSTCISGFVGLILFAGIWFIPFDHWLQLRSLTTRDVRLIVLFLGLSVLLGLQEGLFQAAFRCVGQYAYGTMARNLVNLASFGFILAPVVLGVAPTGVAFTFMTVNAIGTLVMWILLRRKILWIRFGTQHASWTTIRRLSSPAISFMIIPIANSLSLQGILIVIGHVLGPMAVVIFSTARTISRSANQLMQLISQSVWPEMSAAFGAGNLDLARRLHRRSCQLSVALCVGISVAVAVFGNYIWKVWTVGMVATDPVLLYIMLFQLIASSLWFTSSVVPVAINKHQGIARVILGAACLSLLAGWLVVRVPAFGLRGAAAALVLGDVLTTTYVLRTSLKLVGDTFPDFLRSMLQPPRLLRSARVTDVELALRKDKRF